MHAGGHLRSVGGKIEDIRGQPRGVEIDRSGGLYALKIYV